MIQLAASSNTKTAQHRRAYGHTQEGRRQGVRKGRPLLHAGDLFVTQITHNGITNASEAAAAPTTHPLHIHTETHAMVVECQARHVF